MGSGVWGVECDGWRVCRLFYASVGVILLPEEAMTLFPQQHAMYLAAMLGAAVCRFARHVMPLDTHFLSFRAPCRFSHALVPGFARHAVLGCRTHIHSFEQVSRTLNVLAAPSLKPCSHHHAIVLATYANMRPQY